MKTQAIIPTAGVGARFRSKRPKALTVINGKPVIAHTLAAFKKSSLIDSIILVVPKESILVYDKLITKYRCGKNIRVVAGGKTRSESVYNGLQATHSDTQIVLVHDGVRPLIATDLIDRSIRMAEKFDAVVVGVPVKPTIKRVGVNSQTVIESLERAELWEIQTPQVIKRELLVKAYTHDTSFTATDDASLVEKIGVKVKVLEGSYTNIKITTPEDIVLMKALMKNKAKGV